MEKLKYVSPEYQATLETLSGGLAENRRQRLADAALDDTVEFPAIQEELFTPDNIIVGVE